MAKHKAYIPANDDPLYMRTCSACKTQREWVVAVCPLCGEGQFSLPPDHTGQRDRDEVGDRTCDLDILH